MTSNLFSTYNRAEQQFSHGEGAWLFTRDGDRYLDFHCGIAVNALGHSHPALVGALTEQAGKLWHLSNLFDIPGQEELSRILCDNSFADRVFFTNSGAEALECAIKTARRYHFAAGKPEKSTIVTFEGAFHGRTLTTVAAGGKQQYLEGFGPPAGGFVQVPFGDIDAVKAAIDESTAAILLEPIQGEGGIRTQPWAFLRGLRQICDDHGLLLMLDEVQSGIARTGKLFAYEWADVTPDIMALAKGIGGGFPVGACLATEEAAAPMTPGTHGSTYGGNALAMAVARAVMKQVTAEGFLDNVNARALQFRQGLAALTDSYPDVIAQVRGVGLMTGVECRVPNTQMVDALRQNGLLAVPAGDNVVRLFPPLTVSEEEISTGLGYIDAAAAQLSNIQQTAE